MVMENATIPPEGTSHRARPRRPDTGPGRRRPFGPVTTRELDAILRAVSRSFFLSLRLAPRAMRSAIGIGYLFCRAADTIADTRLLPPAERLAALDRLRGPFSPATTSPQHGRDGSSGDPARAVDEIAARLGPSQTIAEERDLLERLPECLAFYRSLPDIDQALLRELVSTLTRGMAMDLRTFPAEASGSIVALQSDAELGQYTYYVAGCVGEFWMRLQVAHIPALQTWRHEPLKSSMEEKAVRFGKALQMTNILRDFNRDLDMGRCYFPVSRLERAGLEVADVRSPSGRRRLRPLLDEYLREALGLYRSGWEYTLAIPRRVPRLRLACALPLFIGLKTLALLASTRDPYAAGSHLKISRAEVRGLLRGALIRLASNRALRRYYDRLESRVVRALER